MSTFLERKREARDSFYNTSSLASVTVHPSLSCAFRSTFSSMSCGFTGSEEGSRSGETSSDAAKGFFAENAFSPRISIGRWFDSGLNRPTIVIVANRSRRRNLAFLNSADGRPHEPEGRPGRHTCARRRYVCARAVE